MSWVSPPWSQAELRVSRAVAALAVSLGEKTLLACPLADGDEDSKAEFSTTIGRGLKRVGSHWSRGS